MKRILIVINTLGMAGAETALMELVRHVNPKEYQTDLYVLLGQGELVHRLPEHIRLLNRRYSDCSVLSREGKKLLFSNTLRALAARGNLFFLLPYLAGNFWEMARKKRILPDKLMWRALSDGAERFHRVYDLAVAFLEGGASYYVADHVKAKKKAAFIHVDYTRAGYTRRLDRDCYLKFDRIFTVSDEVREAFLKVYPQCREKTEIFRNLVDREGILKKAQLPGGFSDSFQGLRILTVGRLTAQKALEVSVEAMALLKKSGENVRWYVLGEGDERRFLEGKIRQLGLERDFLLLGAVPNPYPYLRQADIYVHASRYEGKSIAIQEAQILGKPILVSDCSGNREQVKPMEDGMMCSLTPEGIRDGVQALIHDGDLRKRIGFAAAARSFGDESELEKLFCLLA